MKNFFKIMLATMVGTFITLLVFFFILLGIIGAIVSSGDKTVSIKANSILKLTLNNEIFDRSPNNPFAGINFAGIGKEKQDGLTEIIDNIKKAKEDANIKGIYLELSIIPAHFATIEEIRNALLDFKKSGKFIIAFADYFTKSSYYLATVSDKIYLNPEGGIEFMGLRSEIMFFKGTFEKLGIEVQVFRHGKFKSFVEPYISDKMSPENKLQITKLISSIWDHTLDGISAQRKISKEELNILATRMTLMDADSCLSFKLVDSLFYKDKIYKQLLKLSGQKEKEPQFVSLGKYEKVPKPKSGKGFAKAKIAVVYAQGEVDMGDQGEGTVSSDRISKALREARTDTLVKAIVFRINSPGGSSLASEVIWREVTLATKSKPVVVSMGDLAASGGYYIACPASKIVASPNTITGSIGVFGLLPNAKQFLNQKLGITTDVAKTNEHADFPTISRPLDKQEKAFFQFEVDKTYSSFVSHVSEGRNLLKAKVDEIGQGRIWTGTDALKIGLVDTIGGLNDAISLASKLAKTENYRLVSLPKLEDPFEKFINALTDDVKTRILKSELGEEYKNYIQYKNILHMKGIQARLPFNIEFY